MMLDVRKLCRVAFLLGIAAIIWLSLAPSEQVPAPGVWDKLNHFLAYLVVAAVGFLGYPGRRQLLAIVIGLFLLGAVLELLQAQMPDRKGSLADLLANSIGLFAAYFAIQQIEARLRSERRSPPK